MNRFWKLFSKRNWCLRAVFKKNRFLRAIFKKESIFESYNNDNNDINKRKQCCLFFPSTFPFIYFWGGGNFWKKNRSIPFGVTTSHNDPYRYHLFCQLSPRGLGMALQRTSPASVVEPKTRAGSRSTSSKVFVIFCMSRASARLNVNTT